MTPTKVLISDGDHSYREVTVRRIKVVYNKSYRQYFEYVGDDYLEDNDTVVEMDVAVE